MRVSLDDRKQSNERWKSSVSLSSLCTALTVCVCALVVSFFETSTAPPERSADFTAWRGLGWYLGQLRCLTNLR